MITKDHPLTILHLYPREMNLYGAIIGKAYYTGDIRLDEAIREARG